MSDLFPIGAEWPRQKKFITDQVERLRTALETATTMERVCHVQGQIVTLRMILEEAEPDVAQL